MANNSVVNNTDDWIPALLPELEQLTSALALETGGDRGETQKRERSDLGEETAIQGYLGPGMQDLCSNFERISK